MDSPAIAIPRADLVQTPVDAVVAAITCYVSAVFGPESLNKALPPSHQWLDHWQSLIKDGDEEFAANMVGAMTSPEFGESPNALMLGLTHGALAGVSHKEGRTSEAWAQAAYAALCIGVVAGSHKETLDGTYAVMNRLSAKGVEKRHAKTRQLRDFALSRYKERSWVSANDAANRLKDLIMAEGARIGIRLSESNAQRTIADWLRAGDKDATTS